MKYWRINLILISVLIFGAAIVGRLIFIQIIKGESNKALALGQQKDVLPIKGERGRLFLKTGEILAANISEKYVYISPGEIPEEKYGETAKLLNSVLDVGENEILKKIGKDSLFEAIKYGISDEEENFLKEIKLAGVYIKERPKRNYPQLEMASQVIGFLGGDEIGQYGLEGYYDDILQGKEGFGEKENLPWVNFVGFISNPTAENGSDLVLTIDYNIQAEAERLLKESSGKLNFDDGQIIVMEPKTGKILAMANYPFFDPNEYSKEKDINIFRNGSIQKVYEPGSIFKPITMAGALNSNVVTPQTTYTDKGVLKFGTYTISNYDGRVWGKTTMTEVLEKSINTGAVFAQQQLGPDLFLKYVEKFGFFEKTGIDLQGEASPDVKNLKSGSEINFATASFGQGIAVTPIQMVRAFAAIANGGDMVKPYIVEKILGKDGKIIQTEPQIEKGVISKQTSAKLTNMLVSVVENGFGKAAKVQGYYVAGKTGTAQMPYENKRGYYTDKTWQSFIGFAPALDPSFVILVKLTNPGTKTAEYSAIPIFKQLAQYTVDYLQIPPDQE